VRVSWISSCDRNNSHPPKEHETKANHTKSFKLLGNQVCNSAPKVEGKKTRANKEPAMPIASVNPADGQILKTFEPLVQATIEEKLQRAADTFRTYRHSILEQRATWMTRVAEILEAEKNEFARMMSLEMGKPIKGAVGEVEKCAWVCRYYAENAKNHLANISIATNASRSYVSFQPLGPVLAVMPWNFPFWQVFRFAAPALMAGNVGLLKHASNVPQCALAIEDIIHRAGFPEGVFQTLLIGADAVEKILEDKRVVAATLTGSEPAGRSVAGIAGKQIKKTVLELGGSDPFIVMPSANFDEAVKTAVKSRTINNGQSCIAAKRFIVADRIYEKFESAFVDEMKALRVGDPLDEATDIGPLATEQILRDIDEQVKRSVAEGAIVLTGGKRLDRVGNFYEPTVLVNVPKDSAVSCEEIFGPVASLFRVANIDEAIALANATSFGLGAAAWTNDQDEQERFASELEAGSVFINGMVASDPRLPFGGIKNSGYGRELGEFGIREFVNIKTIWVK
jgi:succinate-semialdehyde dehydrogenase / glutarate-semialdehyde dehydrogenase